MPSLDGYVRGIEAGAGSAGAEFLVVAPEVLATQPVRVDSPHRVVVGSSPATR